MAALKYIFTIVLAAASAASAGAPLDGEDRCRLVKPDYLFSPEYGKSVRSGRGDAFDGVIETKGTPCYVQDADGWWSLKFDGCTVVRITQPVIPIFSGFCLELDVLPAGAGARHTLFATENGGLCLFVENGRACANLRLTQEKFTTQTNALFRIKGAEVVFGEWNHIAFIWDQDVVRIDVNGHRGAYYDLSGELVKTGASCIGADVGGSFPFRGQIRRLRIVPLANVWDKFDFEGLIGKSCWPHDYRGSLFANPPKSAAELADNAYVTLSRKHSRDDVGAERDRQLHRRIAVVAAGPDYGSDGYCCAAVAGGRIPLVPDESALSLKTRWLISDMCEDESFSFFEKHETCGSAGRQHSFFRGGTDVWVNREAGVWSIAGKLLPENGFYARNDDIECGIVLVNDKKRSFCINRKESRAFFDARCGGLCDFGGVTTEGAFHIDVHDDWLWRARPLPGLGAFRATVDVRRLFGRDADPLQLEFAGNDAEVEVRFPLPRPLDLQSQVDAVASRGGGTVVVPSGDWDVKPLVLKSNVTLRLEDGARIFASTNINDYSPERGARVFLYAENAENVTVEGHGVIDGRGYVFAESGVTDGASQPQALPVLLRFSRCHNVRLEGFLYCRSGSWGCHLRNNDGVVVRNVRCFNHCNKSNDGIDIESRNVLIEDCQLDTDDDAICIKSESDADFDVTNVVVRNCRMRTSCSGFKVGTGSWGRVADVLVENCRVERPKACWRFRWFDECPGVTDRLVCYAAVCLGTVDGGTLENVTVRNMSFSGVVTPINIRLGERRRARSGKATYSRNILIDGLKGDCMGWVPSTIIGVPGLRVKDVMLRNLDITCSGGGKITDNPVPERVAGYPSPQIFELHTLPAYAFYIRHAEEVVFKNVKVHTIMPEERPALYEEDVPGLKSGGLAIQ